MSEAVATSRPATVDVGRFFDLDLRAGTIVRVEEFPEARIPAWKVWIDFGPEVGTLPSSARITDLYGRDDLLGRQVVAVVNLPPRQIGPFQSACLVTGFSTAEGVVLVAPDRRVPDGARLH